jgi:phenylpyruvate tautomerase PptA (4-oxalocrotonate tautomerase family)
MPLLKLETTVALSDDQRSALLSKLSQTVAEAVGRTEESVMASISSAAMIMSSRPGDAAFVDIRSTGALREHVNQQLSRNVCALLKDFLGLSSDRVYVNLTHVDASNWAWHGDTLA